MTDRLKPGSQVTIPPGVMLVHAGFMNARGDMDTFPEIIETERQATVDFHWIKREEIDIVCDCEMTRTPNLSRCWFKDRLDPA